MKPQRWGMVTMFGTTTINIVALSEGGRMGHCDGAQAPCRTLGTCWGHELREGAWSVSANS